MSEQTTPPAAAEQATATTPAEGTKKKGWPKGQKRPAKKKVASPSHSAHEQLNLASKFADSCGGISKAIQLLQALAEMKK